MGYRQYFYEVDKSIVDGIRKCKTEEELYDFIFKIITIGEAAVGKT